ncbi:MAG: DUF6240 domain-containing protein [Lachnospiraceae bacterium]|nr:DUF6240 domain-containing protein [Lachnospiraceae bacterium]
MRVDLNAGNINQNADREVNTIAYGNPLKKEEEKAINAGGFTLDISGTVTDNAAYGPGELKTQEQIMQDAGQMDIALQRDFMTVMSNSMSAEDFAKMSEDGFSLSDMNMEEQVTSLDKLKCTMAEAGVVIEGFNDDMSEDELNAITGNAALTAMVKDVLKESDLPVNKDNAQDIKGALDKAGSITPLNNDKIKYMVTNRLEPTIDNLYKAEFSSGESSGRQSRGYYREDTGGYYSKKADTLDWDSIKGQAEKIVENAGLPVTKEAMDEAKWLVSEGIPLTGETINLLNDLKSVKYPLDEESLLKSMAISIADGNKAENASLIKEKTFVEEAVLIKDKTDKIDERAIEDVIKEEKPLNIKNLSKASNRYLENAEETLRMDVQPQKAMDEEVRSDEYIKAARFLEETRLAMTTEANYRLLKNGISVDTLPLEKLVEKLKEAERDFYRPLLDDEGNRSSDAAVSNEILDDRIGLYKQSISIFENLRTIPLETVGRIDTLAPEYSARNINEAGNNLKEQYLKAGKSYETLMTAPRRDMGDSITKAFRNVDDILEDNGLEINEANRKAVRILGYAQNEINRESIERVKVAEQALERVIEKMTPAKTLEMIRKGDNPLDENIFSLNERLNEEEISKDTEKYSKFLVRLEKNRDINDDEKKAFIGIYRLFRQVEKSDGKLLGNVLSEGMDPTLRNIVTAMRNNKALGMDVSVDDGFGALEELISGGESITEQIDNGIRQAAMADPSYLNSLSAGIADDLSKGNLKSENLRPDMSLEEFAYELHENEVLADDPEESLNDLGNARLLNDQVIEMLRSNNVPVSVNNLLAQNFLMNERGKTFSNLFKNRKNDDIFNRLSEAAQNIRESLTDRESAQNAYNELKEVSDELINERAIQADNTIDVREMNLLHKQLSVAAGNALSEDYEVPLEIDGEWTSINLKLVRDPEGAGIVTVTMETETLGRIGAKFNIDNGRVNGYITGNDKAGVDRIASMDEGIRNEMENSGLSITQLNYIENPGNLDLNAFAREKRDEASSEADTRDLYQAGKAFVTVLSRELRA